VAGLIRRLLDAYEIERQPITEQVSRYAMNASLARDSQRSAIPNNLEDAGPGHRSRPGRASGLRDQRRPVLLRWAQLRILL
jgi:hypothetical protein